MVTLGNDWDSLLKEEFQKEYYLTLRKFLKEEYQKETVYPDMHDIFNALRLTPYRDVRVVIFGQDPYHEPNQAHGLCFSVKKGVPKPPSLLNIFKELREDLGIQAPPHGCLESWAKNGVLLLNSVLTVRKGEANSHRGKGWEIFTNRVVELLNQREDPMVFILWGNHAKEKGKLITQPQHLIITGSHPSPLSAHQGFFGGKYFSRANQFLEEVGPMVNWEIPS
ncbi:MAG: uracil-DNA glycosylase [Anaerovoracaceae bacterium]|jgi:uracil-DNA glycosylase